MTKHLVLVRHAESGWGGLLADDFSRSLTERGRADARAMSCLVGGKVPLPDLVVCSGARRALETLDILRSQNTAIPVYETNNNIYNADVDSLKCVISGADAAAGTLMLVGHNPAISEMVRELTGRRIGDLPAAAMACISLDISRWDHVFVARGASLELFSPDMFRC